MPNSIVPTPIAEIEMVETFDGPPEDVWPIVSEPDLLGEWLEDDVELTLRIGAPIRTRGDDGGRVGVIDDVQIGRRLAFTWAPVAPADGPATTVELDLEADSDGAHTVLRIRERIVEVDPLPALGNDFRALALV